MHPINKKLLMIGAGKKKEWGGGRKRLGFDPYY